MEEQLEVGGAKRGATIEDLCGDLQKSPSKPVVTEETVISDEGPLINENSNGLSHLLSDGGFSLEGTADESSNFLTVADLPETADYFEDHSQGFTARTFDAGDNAVGFQENSNSGGITETSQPVGESDGSRNCNDNDDSNVPERGSAINTQDILNDIESEDFQVLDETPMEVDETQMEKSNSLATLNAEESQNSSDRKDPDKSEKRKNHVEARETNQSEPDEDSRTDLKEKSQIEPDVKSQTEIKVKSEHVPGVKSQHVPEVKSHDEAEVKSQVDPEVISLDEPKAKSHAEAEEKETTPLVMEVQETDTEVVSEDELPAVEKPSVQDAENVSDDELPGPKPADLPADTEVVSEDELPTSKKDKEQTEGSRKRKPEDGGDGGGSPVSDAESSSKKQAIVKNGESKPVAAEKRSSVDEKPKKKLPELDKYWKVVNDDPTDFTGWTYLLQYVDQESDVEAAREAYDAFLSHYPYCYGYWRKYADYEKRKGSKKKCFEVLERGLKAIPLSVDLWIHYLNHIKNTKGDEHTFIRQQYDRAIEACGLEFRSDRLWESYIKWESEHGAPLQVTNIYGRLLATPTLGYTGHFDNFQEHVMSENVTAVIDREELVKLRAEVREGSGATPAADLPPGEDEPVDHIANEEEAQAIKERVIALRRKVHKLTGEQVAQRWTFEEGIKRPYFHVKPLERIQLKNWKAYLEWEKQHGSLKRALVLHERCLIACALYEEFWLRLVKFLEEKCEEDPSLVALEREVLERACTVHHLDKPALHLHWAYFEEVQGNAARAADILDRLEKTCPNLVQVAYRRINLERRRGELDKCVQLYETYINSAKSKAIASALAIKYARFLHHARGDSAGAQRVLAEALAKDPLQSRLYLQQLDIALHTPGTAYQELAGYLEAYEKQEGAEPETCAALAWRRLELAEERGSAAAARGAYQHQRSLARHLGKRFRQAKHEATAAAIESKKKESVAPSSSSSGSGNPPSAPTGGGGGGGAGSAYYPPQAPPAQPYDQAAYQQPYQPQWNHYQQPPNPYGHNPWGQYTNYY